MKAIFMTFLCFVLYFSFTFTAVGQTIKQSVTHGNDARYGDNWHKMDENFDNDIKKKPKSRDKTAKKQKNKKNKKSKKGS